MKRISLWCVLALMTAAQVWAVPSFTPTIDGTKDAGWGATPDEASNTSMLPTEFNLDGGMYVTDDGQYIYIGYDADADPWSDGKSVHLFCLIDVGTAGGAFQAPWGLNNVTLGQAFLPDYSINMQWNTGHPAIDETYHLAWTGSSWNQTGQITTDAGGSGQFTEVAIPRTLLGLPAQGTVMHFSILTRPAWDTQGANACVPAQNGFPTDFGGAGGNFTAQFAYTVQTAFGENIPPQILAVHQIDRRSVEIVFNEPMDQATLNQSGNYTPTGWVFSGFRYVNATTVGLQTPIDFVAGNPYSIALSSNIRDIAGNSIDPAFDEATWNGVDYADVTIHVYDQPQLHDIIRFKGSFNFYSEHDPSWSGGNVQMYDDGTHGDAVANDHTFTLIKTFVPNGGTPNFEWGIVDENDQWLLVGPNQSFSVPNSSDFEVSYTIPDVTDNQVTVTFLCDAQYVTDPVTNFAIAGPFNGWPSPGTAMVDPENDKLWSVDWIFPAGSSPTQEFKFQRIDGGNTNWESSANRPFTLDDNQPTQVVGPFLFNDNINIVTAPTELTAAPVGGNIELRWLSDYPRVHYEVYGGTDQDNLVIPENLLGTVAARVFQDNNLTGLKKFYVVRTIP